MRTLVVLLLLSATVLCRELGSQKSTPAIPTFLGEVTHESWHEYRDLKRRWDLSWKEKRQKILEWAEKNGIKESVAEYLEKRRAERKQQRKQFDELLENLPTVGKKYISIWDDRNKTRAQKAAEMDRLRSEYKKEKKI
ncbi:hypothetical protein ANCCAN_12581 [Ancylostoma caninum]|uniref:SXP/RAL-2 family protein Ani s 5-like cation-binding domain-containing protein n=1 Tax=Ancylostoma caninum TaxID=29170 RepID=A0A368GAS3_ANCCA|nr:hypothetical protein ANCCAN_12581 [Ancylostoma caninum]